jgi:hypothetical protein
MKDINKKRFFGARNPTYNGSKRENKTLNSSIIP